MPNTPKFLVCTDLDGTLLDHHTYEWEPAKESIAQLESLGIPVVINTSKTYEEVALLQKEIGLTAPFIVENGSAVYLPKSLFPILEDILDETDNFWVKILGDKRYNICSFIHELRMKQGLNFSGYSDWNVEKIVELTGLDEDNAKLSLNRSYSEPLIWNDSSENLNKFKICLNENNLTLLKGGRFYHALGNSNKGKAMNWLKTLYGMDIPLVSLGDSNNDIDMLEIADYPVLVKSAKQTYPTLSTENPNTIRTEGLGPHGWKEAISVLLSQF